MKHQNHFTGILLPVKFQKIYKYIFIFIYFCVFGTTSAATLSHPRDSIKALSIGDKVPDMTINNLINYPKISVKISDFKGKLLILDFWATWCSSCINNIPKLKGLERSLPDQLRIIAVTDESKDKIVKFFTKKPDYALMSSTDDKILTKMFPHRLLPHCVWIGPGGEVLAITAAEDVNPANIQIALHGKGKPSGNKTDINTHLPLFIGKDLPPQQLANYTILIKGKIDGLPSGSEKRKNGNQTIGLAMMNQPLETMYKIVMWGLMPGMGDSRFIPGIKAEINKGNQEIYSFDFIAPKGKTDSIYHQILKTLNLLTGYNGHMEKRMVPCLAISKASGTNKLLPASGQLLKPGAPKSRSLIVMLNNLDFMKFPVIDETGDEATSAIELSNPKNLDDLKENLSKYGLSLLKVARPLDVFVLEKQDTGKINTLPNH